jgi:hypothetical protein
MNITYRDEAVDRGLTHYFTGNACKRGHVDRRLTSTGHCLSCSSSEGRKWSRRNRWRRERYVQRWAADNKHKTAAASSKRRLAHKHARPAWFEQQKVTQLYAECATLNDVFKLTGNRALQVDHIIPLQSDSVCGLHCWANLQLLSRADNRRKSNTYLQDW